MAMTVLEASFDKGEQGAWTFIVVGHTHQERYGTGCDKKWTILGLLRWAFSAVGSQSVLRCREIFTDLRGGGPDQARSMRARVRKSGPGPGPGPGPSLSRHLAGMHTRPTVPNPTDLHLTAALLPSRAYPQAWRRR